jgi:hypothetical protein
MTPQRFAMKFFPLPLARQGEACRHSNLSAAIRLPQAPISNRRGWPQTPVAISRRSA